MTVLDTRTGLRQHAPGASRSAGDAGATRPRRLRSSRAMRALVRETRLHPAQLVAPIFVHEDRSRGPSAGLPGTARLGWADAVAEARRLADLGVGGVLLFGVSTRKDAAGMAAAGRDGPVPVALQAIRDAGLPLVLAADVCLCAYTTHGHCGVLEGDRVANDASLPRLAEAALAYADAGADVVAPSAMIDRQVAAIRSALDTEGHEEVAILAYAAKHASALYGPFRDAADSTPAFGDRRTYQLDPANARAALRELALDAAEGADILMVKPALTNLDTLVRARERFDLPLAAYQVSGEVAMLGAAARPAISICRAATLEMLTAIARAGADVIVTYLAADAARLAGRGAALTASHVAGWRRRAEAVLPGGVDSPVRAWKRGRRRAAHPRARQGRARLGCRRRRLHRLRRLVRAAHPGARPPRRRPAALRRALAQGGPFGATHPSEVILAERIRAAMPSLERIRFTSSGTEAAMSALRVAGRPPDAAHPQVRRRLSRPRRRRCSSRPGSGLATAGVPDSAGVDARGHGRDARRCPTTTSRRSRRRSRRGRGASLPSSSSPWPPTWASSRRAPGFLEGLRAITRAMARCSSSTRSSRASVSVRRRPGALRRHART